MSLNELCEQIKKKLRLPDEYHIAGVFKENGDDEIIGWAVLDGDNNMLTDVIPTDKLPQWEAFMVSEESLNEEPFKI